MNKRIYLLLFMLLFTLSVTNSVKAQVSGVTRTGQQGTTSETLKFLDLSGNDAWIRPRLARTGENLFYAPLVSTDSSNSITSTTATVFGNVWHHGWLTLSDQGFQIREGDADFTDADTKVPVTADIDNCTNYSGGYPIRADLTGLKSNTTYYFRTYATNDSGTAYGTPMSFKTLSGVKIEVDVPSATICAGNSAKVKLVATETSAVPAGTTYTWTISPAISSADSTSGATTDTLYVTFHPNDTTVYSVTCTSSLGGSDVATVTINVNQKPTVQFASDNSTQSFCDGTAITDITLSNTYSTLEPVNLPEGVTLVGTTISGTPTTPGTYNYVIRAISDANPSCGKDSVKGTITVYSLPSVNLTSNKEVMCYGDSAILTVSGADSYEWLVPTTLSGAEVKVKPTDTTTYVVKGTESTNSCSKNDTIVIAVNKLPNVVLSNASVCAGGTLDLTAAGADTYTWTVKHGALSANSGETVTYTAPTTAGKDSVYVTGKYTETECGKTVLAEITVNALPTVTVSGSDYVCNGDSITLTAAGATSYKWSNNKTTETIHVSETGSYTVEGTDANGCKSTSLAHSVTKESPAVTITAALKDTTICKGGTATLKATTSDVTGNLTYKWSCPSCEDVTTQTNPVSPTVTTDYSVTVTATSTNLGSCTATDNATVTVTVVDPTNFTVNAITGNKTICAGDTTVLRANVTSDDVTYTYTYQWYKGENTISGATLDSLKTGVLRTSTNYKVAIKATSGDCTSDAKTSEVATVTVNQRPQVTIALNGSTATVSSAQESLSYQWYKEKQDADSLMTGKTTNQITDLKSSSTYKCLVSNGLCDTVVSVETEYIPSKISITATPDAVVCYNGGTGTKTVTYTAHLDNPSKDGNYTYKWYVDNDSVPGNHTNVLSKTYGINDGGNHHVKVEVIGYTSVYADSVEVVSVVNPELTNVTINGNKAFCPNGNTTLTAVPASTDGSTITYSWGGENTNSQLVVDAAGTYNVTVTATKKGCTTTKTASAVVVKNDPNDFVVNAISGNNSICTGTTTTLTANPSSSVAGYSYTYQWYNGNDSINLATNATYTTPALTDNATYKVDVKAVYTVDGVQCSSSSAKTSAPYTVTVTKTPDVTLSVETLTVCKNEKINKVIITPVNATIASVTGYPSGINYAADSIYGTPTQDGTFTVKATVTSTPNTTCGTDSAKLILIVNPLPTFNVNVEGTTASVVSPADNVTYKWSTATPNPTGNSVTIPKTGNYSVTATNNQTGCEYTVTFSANNIAESISLNENMDIEYCKNQAGTDNAKKTFTATPTPAGSYTYTWTVNGVQQVSTTNTMTYQFTDQASAKYAVKVSVTGASKEDTTHVTVYELPTLSVQSGNLTQTVCKGKAISPVTFNYSNATLAIEGSSNGLSLTNGVLSGTPTDAGDILVNATSEHNCGTKSETVSISRLDTAMLTVSGSMLQAVCTGDSIETLTFSTNTTLSATTLPAGLSLNSNTLSGAPTANGTFTISTEDLNSCGVKSLNGQVTINARPDVSITGNDAVCSGTSVKLTATPGYTYTWSTGATTASINVAPTETTNYSVTASNGTCEKVASKTVTVNAKPEVLITGNTEMCMSYDQTGKTLTASATPSATYNYSWSDGTTGATKVITAAGTYNLTATATNPTTGCTNTKDITVKLYDPQVTGAVTVSANPGTTICAGNSTTLTANASASAGASLLYSWSGGGTSASKVVSAGGTYTVSVTAKQGNCSSTTPSTASTTVTVNQLPSVTISNNSQSVCQGVAISNMTITPSNANITNVTGFPAGITWSGTTISGSSTAIGTYTVTATVESASSPSCGTATATASIEVKGAHTLSDLSNGTQTVCANTEITPITFTSQYADVSVTGLPSGVTLNTNTNIISGTPTVARTYEYTITAKSKNGCGSNLTLSGTITVKPQPNASITANSNKSAICKGDQITLTVAESEATYSWNPSASTQAVTVTPSTTTTYYVTVTKDGCTATSNKTITVNQLPTVSITPSSTAVCAGSSATFTASAGSSYLWSTNATTQAISVNTADTYSVTVTDANGCKNSASQSLTVNALPEIFLPTINGATICNGNSTTLTASPSGSYSSVSYAWSPSTGLNSTTNASVTAKPTTTTTYTVTATATSTAGCTKTATQSATVTVNSPAITLNNDGMGDQAICTGSSITINAPVASSNGQLSYSWSSSASDVTSTNSFITVTPTANPTTYTVTVTAKVGDCTKSDSKSKKVTLNPLPTISADANATQSVCVGSAITPIAISNLVANSTVTLKQGTSLPNGVSYNAASKQIEGTPTAAGTFNYTLVATLNQTPVCGSAEVSGTITVNAKPDVTSISGDKVFCANANTTLSVASGYTTYAWTKGGSSVGTNSNTLTVTETGSYAVKITSDKGCETDVPAVTVNKIDLPTISVADVSVCQGTEANLSATNLSADITVSWATTGTDCSMDPTTGESSKLNYPSAGTFPVTATATTTTGACQTSDDATVTVTATTAGTVAVTSNVTGNTICKGGNATLTAGVTGNDGTLSYQWYKDDVKIDGATNNTYATGNLDASATYKCVVTNDNNSCTSTADGSLTITVLTPAITDLTITSNPTSAAICNGNSATLTAAATGTGTMSYKWSTNDETADITVTTAGEYSVTATATSTANGVTCTTTSNASKTVSVYNPSLTGVTASASADSICPGGTVYMAVDIESSNGTLTYQWKKDGADISGATSDAYEITSAEASATYTCVVTATDGSCTASATTASVPVVVKSYQLAVELVTPSTELNLCGDATKDLVFATVLKDAFNNKEVTDVTYTWSTGRPSFNYKSDTLTVTEADDYTVSVTASIDGCSSISNSKTVKVTDVKEDPAVLLCEDLRNNGFSVDKVFNGTSKVSPWTGYTFKWYKEGSDEAVAEGESMSYNGTTIDFGNYYCEVTSPHGCKALSNKATLSLPIAGKKATPAPCTVKNLGDNEHTGEDGKLVWVADHQGNEYSVVQIGDQCWLRENMRCTTLPSGREMPKISSTNVDIYQRTAAYFGFVGDYPTTSQSTILNGHTYPDSIFVKYYGYNYNWAAAMDTTDCTQFATHATTHHATNGDNIAFRNRRGICPEGWHLPTDEEFFTMLLAAGVADERGFTSTSEHGHNANVLTTSCDWNTSTADNAPGNYEEFDRNSTYFSALPNGYWWTDGLGQYGRFWTATANKLQTHSGNEQDQVSAWEVELQNSTQQYTRNYRPRWHAYAVRCLRDGVPEITKCAVENLNIRETLDESGDSIVSVADHEGNVYQVVQIGEQCWLKENLRTLSSPSTGESYLDEDGSFSNDRDAKCAIYDGGALYKWWAAVDIPNGATQYPNGLTFDNPPQGICPQGWHLPSKAEFETLIAQVQNSSHVGSELAGGNTWKSTANASRPGDYTYALRNSTKFSASADGRLDGGTLKEYNTDAYLWSSTQFSNQIAWSLNLDYNEKTTEPGEANMKNGYDLQTHDANMRLGFSVRCVRDLTPSASTPYLKLKASTPQAKVCDNGGSTSVTYTAELSLVPATSYAWKVDGVDSTNAHGNVLVVNYTGTGNHTVTCTATYDESTDPLVEAGSATASVNTAVVTGGKAPVIGLCTQYYSDPNYATTHNTPHTAYYAELMSQNNSTCILDWGDGTPTETVLRNEHPEHEYANRGEYTISLTNEDGCTATRIVKFDMLNPCTVTTIGANEIHRDGEASGTISYVKDHENNQYRVVQIGDQCWLAENLRTRTSPSSKKLMVNPGHYAPDENKHTPSPTSKAAHWYRNDSLTYVQFGLLYNWCAAMDTFKAGTSPEIAQVGNLGDRSHPFVCIFDGPRRGVCPEGWHIPCNAEFETLRSNTEQVRWTSGAAYLTGSCLWDGVDGDIYKMNSWTNARQTTFTYPNSYANSGRDKYGFTALPAGEYATGTGEFGGGFARTGISTGMWSSDQYANNRYNVYYFFIGNDVGYTEYTAMKYNGLGNGYSVRCLRDSE